MPRVHFGTKDEPAFELKESADLIAVRTRSTRSAQGVGPVPLPPAAQLADGILVAKFPDAGVEVYQVPVKNEPIEQRKLALRSQPDIRFAGSVLVHPESGEPVLYTENIYIRFREDLDTDECEDIIRSAGLSIKERAEFATNAYFTAAPEGVGQRVFDIAEKLLARDDVLYCHPELIRERRLKGIFSQQWHLKATTVNGVVVNAHVNVDAAHNTTKGLGVIIAIIDDGVAIDHEEFSVSGKIIAPRDATLKTDDPRPKSSGDNHGTACAGVACASGILGASGVAPSSRLMPIRLNSGLGSFRESEAFHWAAEHGADVISCSWGPSDGEWWNLNDPQHSQAFPLPANSRDALDFVTTSGRNGKGCVVLFAAGNGNESVDLDGYASYQKVIAVSACNDTSKRCVYSDFGTAVHCSFPSSDAGHPPFNHPQPITPGIWTTDRPGATGYNPGNAQFGDAAGKFTNDFGGTSSACPGAAGVAALALSINSELRWNEVKELLAKACDRIDPQGGQYDSNGHSKFYGFGRLNAETAVKLARKTTGRLIVVNKLLTVPLPDLGVVEGTIEFGNAEAAERVAVSVRLDHTYIGDLVITAIPPAGRGLPSVVLHNRSGGNRHNLDMVYDQSNVPQLSAYSGKDCHGDWIVRVEDKAAQDTGTLIQIGLQASYPPATDDGAPRVLETSSVVASSKSGRPKKKKTIKKKSSSLKRAKSSRRKKTVRRS